MREVGKRKGKGERGEKEGRGSERKDIKIHKRRRVIHSTKWMSRALGHNSSQGFNIAEAESQCLEAGMTMDHTHAYTQLSPTPCDTYV